MTKFRDREHFEEVLEKALAKARDPLNEENYPSSKPESAVDAKSREITDEMKERSGRQGKLRERVKAGDDSAEDTHAHMFNKLNPHAPPTSQHDGANEDWGESLAHYKKTGEAIKFPKDQWTKPSVESSDD